MTNTPDTHAASRTGLRILLTNNTLASRAGSELYLRDLAIELIKRGHFPIAYSPLLGDVADELRKATIPVIDDLSNLSQAPDVIHGQHHLETMTAVLRFPQTPAVYVCHGWLPWEELPPIFPTISDYVAVDDLCRERLLTTNGIAPEKVFVIRNFVDTARFVQRSDCRASPRSALIFSNYANSDDASSVAIKNACGTFGIGRVDIFGAAAGTSHQEPERILNQYDVVFAKARCAIEAMASGAAVIVTDYAGLAGMVTSDRFAFFRSLNFGARTMQAQTVTEDNILRELQQYDMDDVRRVSNRLRKEASLSSAVDEWLAIYRRLVAQRGQSDRSELPSLARQGMNDASRYLRFLAPVIKTREAAESTSADAVRRASEALQRYSLLQNQLDTSVQNAQARFDEYEAEYEAMVTNLTTQRTALEGELNEQRLARDQDAVELSDRENENSSLLRQIAVLTDELTVAIVSRDVALEGLRTETASLNAQLASFREELNSIQISRAWKTVQRYGTLKKWLRIS